MPCYQSSELHRCTTPVLLTLLLLLDSSSASTITFSLAGLLLGNMPGPDTFTLVQPLVYSFWSSTNPNSDNFPVDFSYFAISGAPYVSSNTEYSAYLYSFTKFASVGADSQLPLIALTASVNEAILFGAYQQQITTTTSFQPNVFITGVTTPASVLFFLWTLLQSDRLPKQLGYFRTVSTGAGSAAKTPAKDEPPKLGCNTVHLLQGEGLTTADLNAFINYKIQAVFMAGTQQPYDQHGDTELFCNTAIDSTVLQGINTTMYSEFYLMADVLTYYGSGTRNMPRSNIFATSPLPSITDTSYPIVQGFTKEVTLIESNFISSKPNYVASIALAGWVTTHVAMQSVMQYSGPMSDSPASLYTAMSSMQSAYVFYDTFYGTFAGTVSAFASSQGAISASNHAGNALYMNQMTGPTALAPNGDFVGIPNSEFIYGLGKTLQLSETNYLSTITLYATAYAVGVSLTDDPVTAYVCDQASVATGLVQRSSLGKVSNHGYRGRCVSSTTTGMTAALAADAATYVTANLVIGVLPDGLDTSTSFVVDPIPASPSLRTASANTVYLFATLEQQLYVVAVYLNMYLSATLTSTKACGVVRGPQSAAILDLMNLTMTTFGMTMQESDMVGLTNGENMVTSIPASCDVVLLAGIAGSEVSALQTYLVANPSALAFVDFDALTMNYPNFVTSFGTNAASTRLLFATNLPSWSPATASTAPPAARRFISAAGANYNTPAALRQMYVSLLIDQLTNNGNTQALPTNLQANFDKIDTAISLGGVSFGPFNTQGCLSVAGTYDSNDCLVNMGARNLYVWSLGYILTPGRGPLTVPTTPSMMYNALYVPSASGSHQVVEKEDTHSASCRDFNPDSVDGGSSTSESTFNIHPFGSSSTEVSTKKKKVLDGVLFAFLALLLLLLIVALLVVLWLWGHLRWCCAPSVSPAKDAADDAKLYEAVRSPSTKDELSRCDAVTVATVDVAASVALWSTVPRAMSAATLACRRAVRAAAVRHGCYEVRHVGDVFVFACRDTLCALAFAADVQRDAGGELKSCVREEVAASYERLRSVRGDASSVKPPAPTPASTCLLLRVGVHAGTRTPNEDLCASCLRLGDVALRASHLSRCGGVVATSIAADDVHEDAGLVSQGRYNLSDDEHVEVFSTTPLCISGEDLESEPVMFPHGLRLLEEGRECRPKGMIDVVRQIVRGINMSSCSRTRNCLLEHTCESFALTGTVQREDCPVRIFSVLQEGQLSELVAQRVAAVLERCGLRPIVEREVGTLEAMELVEGDGMHTREVVERGLLLADGRRAVFTRVERQERVGCRPTKAMTTAEGLAAENPLVPSTMRGREGAEGEPVAAQEGLMEGSMGSPMSFALSPGFGFGTGAGMVNVGRCDSRNISRAACNSVELPEDAAADAGDDAEWTQNDLDTDASLNVRYNRLLHSSRFAASSRPEMAREEGEEVEQAEQQQLASARGGGRRPSRVVAAEDEADSPVDESSINEDLDGTQSRRHRHSRRHGDNDTSITDHLRSRTMLSTFLTPEEVNYRHGRPTFDGDRITPCFKQDNGLLFRMVNTETGQWAYYNDTTKYMMHIHFLAGRASKLVALGDTRMECPSEHHRRYEGELWVAPLATELLFAGSINGYDVKYRAVPVKRLR